jgi:hypothetical protein
MKFQLYKQVVLMRHILEHGLRRGDVSGRTGLSCRSLRSRGVPQTLQFNRRGRKARKGTARLQEADPEGLEKGLRKISVQRLL